MKEKRRICTSLVLADAPPEVLRAHAIRDTIQALFQAGALEALQNAERDQVAEALSVPALWIDAAIGDTRETATVSLDLLHEWKEWEARVLRGGKAVA